MTTTPASLAQEAHTKFMLGRQRLERAGDDSDMLGLALISLHGALEDYFRAVLSASANLSPELRASVLDRREIQWKELLDLMAQHGGLSRDIRRQVLRVNGLRQAVAHGASIHVTRAEVEHYAECARCLIDLEPASGFESIRFMLHQFLLDLWRGKPQVIRRRTLLFLPVVAVLGGSLYNLARGALDWPMPFNVVGMFLMILAAVASLWCVPPAWRLLRYLGLRRIVIALLIGVVSAVVALTVVRPTGQPARSHLPAAPTPVAVNPAARGATPAAPISKAAYTPQPATNPNVPALGTPPAAQPGAVPAVGQVVSVAGTAGSALRLRAEPSMQAAVVARIRPGARLTIVDGPRASGGYTWWRVHGEQGQGWCVADYLAPASR